MERIRKLREQLRMGKSIYDLPLRVTYYARVSTDKLEQQGSLKNQVQYYTEQIERNQNWSLIDGYIDEGISGTSTDKREDFLRMIADAHRGRFDFILTKEISRFSRSTLDSIRYTQELLDAGVGVLFQNDNINTLDTDSEFRLVVMAGVAQDEVRKLSERLKFGFRQSIRNGHVLGNDRMWGYEKKAGKLYIKEEEAQAIRMIFTLYSTGQYGVRRLAKELTKCGYTTQAGTDFSEATIRSILRNPKYKGWYCGHKTQSLDYRTKRRIKLQPEEWVLHPDETVPAIISEVIWEKANTLLNRRGEKARLHAEAYQNRYPYSGKIFCEKHRTPCHRRVLHTAKGEVEYWSCRMYRQKGRAGCELPNVRSTELNTILSTLIGEVSIDHKAIMELVWSGIQKTAGSRSSDMTAWVQKQLVQMQQKKEKLLELSVAGVLSNEEFKEQNDRLNEQCARLYKQQQENQTEQRREQTEKSQLMRAMQEELCGTLHEEVAAALLEQAVICADSTKEKIHIHLQFGLEQQASVYFTRRPFTFCREPC